MNQMDIERVPEFLRRLLCARSKLYELAREHEGLMFKKDKMTYVRLSKFQQIILGKADDWYEMRKATR
jgi:hypothetical protein